MVISAHQPAYLPWLGYFHKIATCEKFVILDEVQFEKNSFTNRNSIRGKTDSILLTVPVLQKGHLQGTIKDLGIDNSQKWREKHWRSISLNYSKAPFYKPVKNLIEDIYSREWDSFEALSDEMLLRFLSYLKIQTPIIKQSQMNISGAKQDLILEICKALGAKGFVFGKLGRDYVDKDLFRNSNVEVFFQEYCHPTYRQFQGSFMPFMSVLDLIMNVDADEALATILSENVRKYSLGEQ